MQALDHHPSGSRARALAALGLVFCVVASCGQQQELPPPGAEDGVLYLWRGGDEPMRVAADRVLQGEEALSGLRLQQVRAELPLRDGRLWLRADAGRYGGGRLTLAPPVLLHGRLGPSPVVGRAEGAAVESRARALELRELTLVRGSELLRFATAVVPEDWDARALSGEGIHAEPAPALWTAALGAIAAAESAP